PEMLGVEDARGEAPLLCLGAVGEDGGARDADAEVADDLRRPGVRHLLDVGELLGDTGVAAAVLAGPRDADPARLGQLPLPGAQPAGSPSTRSSCGSGPTARSWASSRSRPTRARR